ncbi:aldehyde dehydrogenase [Hymenobacter qilianensis]|uniref:Aldehyde dehydrogenase n=2 Tax=Hymenobacter qilianensis TaxID=1385715 RepID=A0ACB5PMU6_9BACT|nr:aldehyde dehydrogenase family protein [Hymenobacter qilianensis]QNP53651.1 aldehyde dehydrogenase family protein [Hymenobacter qilianensis]GGF54251.1 aldehyde dehydrogenase [Hymenobacter qilianensis]
METLDTPIAAASAPFDPALLPELFGRLKTRSEVLRREGASERIARLRKLSQWIENNRTRIQQAMYADFRKPAEEVDMSEIYVSQVELKHTMQHLAQWMRSRRVGTPLAMMGTKGWVQPEPKGVVLIIAPWNYPFYLAVDPLTSALAAGNCCILKPSEMTPATSVLIRQMVEEVFDPSEVVVCEGDKDVSTALLKLPFDHIFFTGSPQVGKIVMRAAAEHLTSVTLELGGKSPVLVDETAHLRDAAEKIVWGKFLNAGQTCVAPDYLLVHEKVRDKLIDEIRAATRRLHDPTGEGVQQSNTFARIVNKHHFQRVSKLLEEGQRLGGILEMGGIVDSSDNFIEPTLLAEVPVEAGLWKEEIFGPVLPLRTYSTLMEAVDFINDRPRPLALYLFSRSAENRRYVLKRAPAGGVALNDTIIHLMHPELPFGGLGNSGMGRAHGRYGFDSFSNLKAVLKQRVGQTSIKLLYPPYTPKVKQMIEMVMKWF